MKVFTYGTLMFQEVWDNVVRADKGQSHSNRHKEHQPIEATLKGYSRRKLRNRIYPGIVQQQNSSIQGVLWNNISKEDLKRLDHFENQGFEYLRIKVNVKVGSEEVQAWSYLYNWSQEVTEQSWDVDSVSQKCKDTFAGSHKRELLSRNSQK